MTDTKRSKIERILAAPDEARQINGTYCFLSGDRSPKRTSGDGLIAAIQHLFKRINGRFYNVIRRIVAPVCYSRAYYAAYDELLAEHGQDAVVINLGSGPDHVKGRTDIINVDFFAFDEVDICCDVQELPLRDDSVDCFLNIGLLEHVERPDAVMAQIHRTLKPGGKAFVYAPFAYPIHGAPSDFNRLTGHGLARLCKDYSSVRLDVASGPTSAMLSMTQEWLACLLCGNNALLHDLLLIVLMATTFPLKYLDKLLYRVRISRAPGGYYAILTK